MKKILFSLFIFFAFLTDTNAQTWTAKESLPTVRAQHGAVAHPNGKIYIFGGYDGGSQSSNLNTTVIAYNPILNTHTIVATMPYTTRGLSYTLGANNLIYIFSGFSGSIQPVSAYSFNVDTNTFSAIADLPFACWEGSTTTGLDGKIYVIGGESAADKVQIYNPSTNTWTAGATIPVPVLQHKAITGNDGKIYVFGGNNGLSNITFNTVQIYNPATNTWSSGAAMPVAKNGFGIAKMLDGKIYIIGGKANYFNSSGPFYDTVDVYDPILNSFTSANSLPIALGETSTTVVNGVIYVIGGTNGPILNNVYAGTFVVPPTISCPANITVINTTGQCGASVTFAATETVGIPASVITYSTASGEVISR
jgi:N-acetylneuraminic acid mutarotase